MTTISTSAFYERATSDFTSLRKRAEELQTQVATGQRLSRSSDDPLAASRLRQLSRAESLSATDLTNANTAMTDLELADGALSEMADNLVRAKELATQAASGTISAELRTKIGIELSSIRDTLVSLANSKDSAGHALFGGQGTATAYTLDASGNPVYAGTAASGEVALGDGQSVTRGVTGPEFLTFTHGGSATDAFRVLGDLAAAIQASDPNAASMASDALDALETGLDRMTTAQTVVGARMNWVDINLARYERQGEARAKEQQEVGEVDAATAISELQQIMAVLDASQASFAKLSSMSLFDVIG